MECRSCHAVGFEPTDDGLCVLCHRIVELEEMLEKSVRVEKADFDGERGCRFIVGEDHVVAEWRGNGVAADTVFVEKPALKYLETTSPLDRCIRMVLEMVNWEVACAMLAGPGDGKLEEFAVKYRVEGTTDLKVIEKIEEEALAAFDLKKFMRESGGGDEGDSGG